METCKDWRPQHRQYVPTDAVKVITRLRYQKIVGFSAVGNHTWRMRDWLRATKSDYWFCSSILMVLVGGGSSNQNSFAVTIHYQKFELMLTRRAKAYISSSCSQIVLVYLQPFRRNSLLKCAPQPKIAKINKTFYFGSSGSFKVTDVDTTRKLVTACCDRRHAHAYLQPSLPKTGQQRR